MAIRVGLGLLAADVRDDLSRFHLLHYGDRVDGFLISGHNSGTHWLRFMLSAAIAHHLDLPRPIYSSGPLSDVFIGHARHRRLFPHAPKIGSSHHMPSRLIGLLGAARFIRLPPIVLLVRHIPDSLLSYFFKWRDEKDLGDLQGYLSRAPRAQGVDIWWFIRFFNRWGRLKQVFPRAILVVRYEDVQRDPATWVRRIWSHWGVDLDAADLRAAMAVSSRTAVQACLDPAYGEDIAPDRAARDACRYGDRDVAVLEQRLSHHLRHTFGYAASVSRVEPAVPPRERETEPVVVAA
ncbi:MAG: sulfotransferase domain-containing protein [Proteobacteria bacterium]|nr:sulfotransferase domain-containing protein [Pseudomonadota bacterium]